jgi:hypothetical protein
MRLFKRTSKARKKWHKKAWMVNPNKTKVIIVSTAMIKPRHVPPWVYKRELDPAIQDMYTFSNIRRQYCSPLGCPINNATDTSYRDLSPSETETSLSL